MEDGRAAAWGVEGGWHNIDADALARSGRKLMPRGIGDGGEVGPRDCRAVETVAPSDKLGRVTEE
jgi:hypothetical protein